jgi:hypothetical protein
MRTNIYTTQTAGPNSFVIDYDAERQVFITTRDRHPLTAAIILKMLNGWAKVKKVYTNASCQITVSVDGVRCEISRDAVNELARVYWQREHETQFPYCRSVLPELQA